VDPEAGKREGFDNYFICFQHFGDEEYEKMVIPANVAVEALVAKLLSDYYKQCGISKDRLRIFW
jgi:hypothetical protein